MHAALLLGTLLTAAPIPGTYDELVLGYDPEKHHVTGFFSSGTGQGQNGGPAFSCIFFFEGDAEGDHFAIKSYAPGDDLDAVIEGTLSVPKPRTVAIHLEQEHGGCWNVQHFADSEPATFAISTIHPWRAIRVVKAAQAHFYDAPGAPPPEPKAKDKAAKGKDAKVSAEPAAAEPQPRKAYVVAGDAVGVVEAQTGWVKAEYAGKKLVSGWIREADLWPLR